eukprot:scaffold4214_cov185-Alexandrium_tamarense.AAC.3
MLGVDVEWRLMFSSPSSVRNQRVTNVHDARSSLVELYPHRLTVVHTSYNFRHSSLSPKQNDDPINHSEHKKSSETNRL